MGNRKRFQAYQNYLTQGNNPEIAQYYQIEEIGLIETSRGQAKLTDIAREFHAGHYSTVSQTIGRLNKLMREDAGLAKEFNMLSQYLTL
ncbi:MAG: hypothetical protein GY820_09135 [Gammaproteobacteria bacterium]|nr:hypothetical protein [Gammaproteobacteria bacterium]